MFKNFTISINGQFELDTTMKLPVMMEGKKQVDGYLAVFHKNGTLLALIKTGMGEVVETCAAMKLAVAHFSTVPHLATGIQFSRKTVTACFGEYTAVYVTNKDQQEYFKSFKIDLLYAGWQYDLVPLDCNKDERSIRKQFTDFMNVTSKEFDRCYDLRSIPKWKSVTQKNPNEGFDRTEVMGC